MIDARAFAACLIAAAGLSGCDCGAPGGNVTRESGVNPVEPVAAPPQPAAKAAPVVAAPTAGPVSVFTSLDLKQCEEIARNDAEAGYARYRCAGVAGYRIEVVESDLRQTINLIAPGGRTDPLALSALVAGGGFSSLGKTAEWRGVDAARPRTLTVRYGVNEDPDPAVAPRSYLVVIRLAAPACAVARVSPGARQSIETRAIADAATLPPCIGA